MAYGMDLRRRVAAAVRAGVSMNAVAERFMVTQPTVSDWCEHDRKGRLEPDKPGPTGPRVFTEAGNGGDVRAGGGVAGSGSALRSAPAVPAEQQQPTERQQGGGGRLGNDRGRQGCAILVAQESDKHVFIVLVAEFARMGAVRQVLHGE